MTPLEFLEWCVVISVAVPALVVSFRFTVDMWRGDELEDEEDTKKTHE